LVSDKTFVSLSKALGYQFTNESLLAEALTHRSVGNANNERLEYLGDSILNFVIASCLFNLFPKASEGDLSRHRAQLVKGETLAEIGKELCLGDFLRLGAGELKSGGFRRASILADAVEAILGAAFLDGGFESCRDLILRLYASRLKQSDAGQSLKDPKTKLQEYLQSRKLPLPEYEVTAIAGEAHSQFFHIACKVAGIEQPVCGSGSSRRRAEQEAAIQALVLLGIGDKS